MRVQVMVVATLLTVLTSNVAIAQVISPSVKSERLRALELKQRHLGGQIESLQVLSKDTKLRLSEPDRLQSLHAELAAINTEIALERSATPEPQTLFLTMAGVEGGTASPQVSIDAAQLFFRNGSTRLHIRSTLSTDINKTTTPAGTLDERIKAALNDPYGGVLYVGVAQVRPLCVREATREGCRSRGKGIDGEGVFVEVRAGAKFVQLPGEVSNGMYTSTAFGVLTGGLRVRQSLWLDTSATHGAGVFELSAFVVVNRASNRSISPLTSGSGELAGWPTSLNVAIGIRLVDNIGLTLRGAPWTNKELSRDFRIGISILK